MDIYSTLIGIVLGLLGNYASSATQLPYNFWQRRLDEQLANEQAMQEALASRRSLRDELRHACRDLSENIAFLDTLSETERQIWLLLGDPSFQDELAEWLMAGGIEEGAQARSLLDQRMENALLRANAGPEQIAAFKAQYFDALDHTIFSVPVLAHWRHQLSLIYVGEHTMAGRRAAEQAVGIYPTEVRQAALERYYNIALKAWDIIDLSNLPEGDVQIATQTLLLRQLYMPLRITVEAERDQAIDTEALSAMERRRDERRLREAGRFVAQRQVSNQERGRVSTGIRLETSQRLVVLGDPGGGKSTLLRWMATSYLLRLRGDPTSEHIPDVETLPDWQCIPVLIRCRELGDADLCRSFADFLHQHLRKSELLPEEADVVRAIVLEQLATNGDVLLLIDGIDEITNTQVRVQFCQELERTAARYPNAPIVVTSRIVGYRDMPYRMGNSFEHSTIAELSGDDKDRFAQRWIAVTEQHQPATEQALRINDLIEALHSNERVERLTGNPLLLTTFALVKRKVGKLPSRRNKLYAEAVGVLLNWNPRYYEVIDEAEAVPQLAYIAYEMCRTGVQRLTEDRVLDLLEQIRLEYPKVRAVRQREPEEFLELLEARSSILIKSGGEWRERRNREEPIWEFRHLTFQEYLAARALIDGRYPDRDRTQPLAEVVAPLAGALNDNAPNAANPTELAVTDSWQEALRLLVADCNDDDVEDVLLAIATPLPDEDGSRTLRPRVVLAARCLADEPNVEEATAQDILNRFVAQVSIQDGNGPITTTVDSAAIELGRSIWSEALKHVLIREFLQGNPATLVQCGGLWSTVAASIAPQADPQFTSWFSEIVETLDSENFEEAAVAALTVMVMGYKNRVIAVPGMIDKLLHLLRQPEPLRTAAAWAFVWLSADNSRERSYIWRPQRDEVLILIDILQSPGTTQNIALFSLITTLSRSDDTQAVDPLIAYLDHADRRVRIAAVEGLEQLGSQRAVVSLIPRLGVAEGMERHTVISALTHLGGDQAAEALIAHLENVSDESERHRIITALGTLGGERAVDVLIVQLRNHEDEKYRIIEALGKTGVTRASEVLVDYIDDPDPDIQLMAVAALHRCGDHHGRSMLMSALTHSDHDVRCTAVQGFAAIRDNLTGRLLSRDLDNIDPWLDPAEPITLQRVEKAAQRLGMDERDVQARYEALAAEIPLILEWRTPAGNEA